MINARTVLLAALVALVALYLFWFRGDTVASVVFALPAALSALGVWLRRRTAGFWSAVIALFWFSHGVMVAWTRAGERGLALAEVALAVIVVFAASIPGMRARFARPPRDPSL